MSKEIKEPKCKTCSGSGKIPRKEKQHCRLRLCTDLSIPSCFRCQFYIHEKPCPDCPEQPPAGEWAKEFRQHLERERKSMGFAIWTRAKEACDRLDRSEAEIKKYIEMDKYKSKQIILGTENYNRICKRVERLEASRNELLDACRELVKFCYPDGKWRGWDNMKGILEIMQPVRRLVAKEVKI